LVSRFLISTYSSGSWDPEPYLFMVIIAMFPSFTTGMLVCVGVFVLVGVEVVVLVGVLVGV